MRVGHTTIISGEGKLDRGKGPVRTGVTCVMPHIDVYRHRLIGGTFVLNGAGEVATLLRRVNEQVGFGRLSPAEGAKQFIAESNAILARG